MLLASPASICHDLEHLVDACRSQISVQGGDPRRGTVKLMQAVIASPSIQDTASEMADTFAEQLRVASGNSSNPSMPQDLILRYSERASAGLIESSHVVQNHNNHLDFTPACSEHAVPCHPLSCCKLRLCSPQPPETQWLHALIMQKQTSYKDMPFRSMQPTHGELQALR